MKERAELYFIVYFSFIYIQQMQEKRFWTELQHAFPRFNLLLIYCHGQVQCVNVIPKYLNFATLSVGPILTNNLLDFLKCNSVYEETGNMTWNMYLTKVNDFCYSCAVVRCVLKKVHGTIIMAHIVQYIYLWCTSVVLSGGINICADPSGRTV